MPAIQTMGRIFRDQSSPPICHQCPFSAFGIALIRCIYSKPQTEEALAVHIWIPQLVAEISTATPLLHVGDYQITGGKELRLNCRRRQGGARSIDCINVDRDADLDMELRACRVG